jgi:hypothetical protein
MTGIDEKRKIGELLKEEILKSLVEPSYYSDVNETIKGRKCWRISGHVFESMSKILLAISGVLSFAAGVYDDKILSFVAGTLSTISLATFQFSLYSMKMHKKNSYELNQLLEKLDIETLPVFEGTTVDKNVTEYQREDFEPDYMCRRVETDVEKEKELEYIPITITTSEDDEKKTEEKAEKKEEEKNLIE